MAPVVTNAAGSLTALTLAWGFTLTPAWASPPASRNPAGAALHAPIHLDLRAPGIDELGPSPAPAHRGFSPGTPGEFSARDGSLPDLGSRAGETRVMSRAESLVRHFRREGLPLARLWETRSTLVSLGLNPKGKPGLWFVRQTR